jgi:hypothetical protein
MSPPWPEATTRPTKISRVTEPPDVGHAPEPPPGSAQPAARAAPQAAAKPRPLRQAWQQLARMDTAWRQTRNTAPLPLPRWAAALGVFIGLWIAGIPTQATGWICPGAIVALLILPDAGTISFGGLKLEMLRQNKAEIEQVRERVQHLQLQQAAATATASAGVTNNYYAARAAETVAEIIHDANEGESAKVVSAQDVLKRFTVAGIGEVTPPSNAPGPESSLEP